MLQKNPHAKLFYLDTDFLFPETYEVRDRIIAKYGLDAGQVHQMKSELTPGEQAKQFGDALWSRDPDQCCKLRKLELFFFVFFLFFFFFLVWLWFFFNGVSCIQPHL